MKYKAIKKKQKRKLFKKINPVFEISILFVEIILN